MVTIRFGCQKLELEADGRTVGELAEAAEGVLNTAGNESFRVEGKGGVDGDYVPADGDVVELVKPAGSKG